MRAITFVLYGLTLVAAHGQSLAALSIGHSTPSVVSSSALISHSDGSAAASIPTSGYVPAIEHRDAVCTAKPQLSGRKSVALEVRAKSQAQLVIRIPPILLTTLDIRPVEE